MVMIPATSTTPPFGIVQQDKSRSWPVPRLSWWWLCCTLSAPWDCIVLGRAESRTFAFNRYIFTRVGNNLKDYWTCHVCYPWWKLTDFVDLSCDSVQPTQPDARDHTLSQHLVGKFTQINANQLPCPAYQVIPNTQLPTPNYPTKPASARVTLMHDTLLKKRN